MAGRSLDGESRAANALNAPISIYEVHLGSWMRVPSEGNRSLSYREAAPKLIEYVQRLGFTHVEFLPLMDHPFFGSWGYQTTGYFAPSGNYGTPQDLMYLIDELHQHDIGVILDWVPSHFPTDAHGLSLFRRHASVSNMRIRGKASIRTGTPAVFNYSRNEVRSFLISSALFWLDKYHADGLRVDAVASMLYLDYSRKEGEWIPNRYGGRENLEAIAFLRRFNEEVYRRHPDVQTFAEESTSWPSVSRPTYAGGLGFGMKWDMGWMHDTLEYMAHDPVYRKYHHRNLTFRMLYAFHGEFRAAALPRRSGPWEGLAAAERCRATIGRSSPISARSSGTCMRKRPRNSFSWVERSVNGAEWAHDDSLDWNFSNIRPIRVFSNGSRTSTVSTGLNRRSMSSTLTRVGSNGSTARMSTPESSA